MKATLALTAVTLLLGCAGFDARDPVPALVVGADAASRAELQQVVGRILRRDHVMLADDALTTTSDLVIEPARPQDQAGRLLDGRDLRRPERFRLLVDGGRCVLRYEANGRSYLLTATHCVASSTIP